MADISVFTLQRLYALPTTRVSLDVWVSKALKHLNTSDVSGRDSLRVLYKDSVTYNGPLRFQTAVVITLPNEVDALTSIISKPQED
jgi:hypothetical protein